MAARNDITGDAIRSKPGNDNFGEGWDRIFGKKKEPVRPTQEEMIQGLIDYLKQPSEYPGEDFRDFLKEFKEMPECDLIWHHHSLGRWIRNTFKLWEFPWEPELHDGVDYSPNHPDSISQRVIEAAWKQLQD